MAAPEGRIETNVAGIHLLDLHAPRSGACVVPGCGGFLTRNSHEQLTLQDAKNQNESRKSSGTNVHKCCARS